MAVVGGVLVQLFNGVYFLWASISNYVLSYMYIYDKNVEIAAIFYVDLALLFLHCMGYQIGTYLLNTRKWNPKLILTLGGFISLLGIFLSSFTTDLMTFILLYGILSGIGSGITYMIPLVCCWEWFP